MTAALLILERLTTYLLTYLPQAQCARSHHSRDLGLVLDTSGVTLGWAGWAKSRVTGQKK